MFSHNLALTQSHFVEIVKQVLLSVLTSKQVDLVVGEGGTVAISCRRDVTLLLTFKPPENFELPSSGFELVCVDYVTILVCFNLALLLVNLFMEPRKDVCIIKAILGVVDSAMDQHLVTSPDHYCYVALSRGWSLVGVS